MTARTATTFWDVHWEQYGLPRRINLRSVEKVGVEAWLSMQAIDKSLTTAFRALGVHPEGPRLSQQIVAIARAEGNRPMSGESE